MQPSLILTRAAIAAACAVMLLPRPSGIAAPPHLIDSLDEGFTHPPVSARPLGWWHWVNGNITKEGITADMESAKNSGMGGVQMFDVEIHMPHGPVRYGSDAWFEHVQFAIRKAAGLGLEFHVMNTPGWSASAGPWVTPEKSMKRLIHPETDSDGGSISLTLAQPDTTPFHDSRGKPMGTFYKDIAVIAVSVTTERIANLDRKNNWAAKPVNRPDAGDRPGIPPEQVIDLTSQMDSSGKLTARLPAGRWTILRFGFTTTGKTNHPAVPEGLGLEIDKLDADAVTFQFEHVLGRMIREAGPLAGITFSALLFDSFEGGFQNRTDALPAEFSRQESYDLIPWMPVLAGRIVESAATSESVLWDFRDVIENLIAENHLGTMHRLAARHGMRLYSESQGGPLNPMSANRHVDAPMNEFWTPDAASRADAPVFRQTPSGISLPLHLEPWGSTPVVFRRPLPENWAVSTMPAEPASAAGELPTASATAKITCADKCSKIITLPEPPPTLVIPGPWTVEFKDGRGAPPVATFATLTFWSEHADPGIRYYSGTGIYRATVQIAAPPAASQRALLDLGRVADIARVYINGHDIGILWKPHFRADITAFPKPNANTLEVHAANRWINRLIGDETIPAGLNDQKKGVSKFTDGRLPALPGWLYEPAKRNENKRHSFSVWKHHDAGSPLFPRACPGLSASNI